MRSRSSRNISYDSAARALLNLTGPGTRLQFVYRTSLGCSRYGRYPHLVLKTHWGSEPDNLDVKAHMTAAPMLEPSTARTSLTASH